MARIALATTAVTKTGIASALQAATTDGEIVDVGDDLTLVVVNKSGSSTTATVQTPMQVDGLDVAEATLVVPAGQTGFLALDSRLFRRTSAPDAGKAYVTCTPITTVTLAVVQR